MCGIAGIFKPNGQFVDEKVLSSMTDSMTHRGPDGRGVWCERNIGLGHRRLSILDLSDAGACPMLYVAPDGRKFRITYNGEVYNFAELRSELEKIGHRFHSQTDTEVVVAAYAQWGLNALYKFNGMWALAIWDEQKQELFLARDRFAVKPLYFLVSDFFAFASEMKAFLSLQQTLVQNDDNFAQTLLNPEAIIGTADNTLIKNVYRLRGGHYLLAQADGQVNTYKWWETSDYLQEVPKKIDEQVDYFRQLFFDAVRLRMRSDVPIGIPLSGGVDSSAVACAIYQLYHNSNFDLSRCADDYRKAVVASFPKSAIDEVEYAQQVATATGMALSVMEFSSENAAEQVTSSLWAVEEAFMGFFSPLCQTYKALKNLSCSVALDGGGADELLGGYPRYLDFPWNKVCSALYADFHSTLNPRTLRIMDATSMSQGFELRSPFLDYRLVTYCFSLGPEVRFRDGLTKWIAREAVKGIMPEAVRTRRWKIGFNTPLVEWFNGALVPFIEKICMHPRWRGNMNLVSKNNDYTPYILTRCRQKNWTMNDWVQMMHITVIINATLWQIMFIDGENIEC